MKVLCFIAAIFALIDLFNKNSDRVLPWYGDAIVLGGAAVAYVVIGRLNPEDD